MAEVDLSTLSNQMVTAQALGNLIMAWPDEQVGIQPETQLYGDKTSSPEKFLFHIEGKNQITLKSDVTRNWVEDNTSRNDHIALEPETIQTEGFVGELNNVTPEGLEALKQASEKIEVISAYMPNLSISALQAYNRALQGYQAISIVKRFGGKIPSFSIGLGGIKSKSMTTIDPSISADEFASNVDFGSQNQQQVAFQKFYGYWRNKTLFTVQTPWAIFKNCAIELIDVFQDEDTKMMSKFNVTFIPIRVARTIVTSGASDMQGRAYFQAAPTQDSGMSAVNFENISFESLDVIGATA